VDVGLGCLITRGRYMACVGLAVGASASLCKLAT
jgi:hypothetical protein